MKSAARAPYRPSFLLALGALALFVVAACDDAGGEGDADEALLAWSGEPLPSEEPGAWRWVDVEGARCRDGSATGLGVRYGTENRLLIYFRGGGICLDKLTCRGNIATFGAEQFEAWQTSDFADGIFSAQSPVADWHQVYLPYCTGDVLAGDHPGAAVPGVDTPQDFVGADNVRRYLERVIPTFADADEVLVVGTSAGGIGAVMHFDTLSRSWPSTTPVSLVNDSGLLMPETHFPPCLQQQMRELWNLDAMIPEDCEGCVRADGGGFSAVVPWLLERHPHRRAAWIAATDDLILRLLYGYGRLEQGGPACEDSGMVESAFFGQGVATLRDGLRPYEQVSTWVIDAQSHTWVQWERFFEAEAGGVRLEDFLTDFIAGGAPRHVGP